MSQTELVAEKRTELVMTILVVDDEPDMRLVARAVLEGDGLVVVDEAVDGLDALAKYRGLNPPPVPTVIVLDNRMPNKSGLEVAAEILRELPSQIVILFSAYLDDEVVAQALALGVAACVAKNDLQRLPSIIRAVAAARG